MDQRFLLPEDAERLITQASASNVGDPAVCTGGPVLLPATGLAREQSFPMSLLALLGLLLVSVALGLRKLG